MTDMFWPIGAQLRLLLQSVLFGAGAGLVYDVPRAVRRYFRLGRVGTALCDAAFWLAALGALFEFSLTLAAGQNRYYVAAGIAAGALLYAVTLSEPVQALLYLLFAGAARTIHAVRRAAHWVSERTSRLPVTKKTQIFMKKFIKPPSIFGKKGLK